CKPAPTTDLEIKNVAKADFHSYGFSMNVCVNGSSSINDLKSSISGLLNFPWAYDVIDSSGNKTRGPGGVSGGPEDLKNGACQTFYWTIQPTHQPIFDQTGKVEITLDENNLIKETNENNNKILYDNSDGAIGLNVLEKQLASIRESVEAMLKDFLKR
ncbi:hypothetical protein KKA24_01165, partial [Patescibacteria group bacterium]|nr:hypothetical protein [Patescibacteria group bacterium]